MSATAVTECQMDSTQPSHKAGMTAAHGSTYLFTARTIYSYASMYGTKQARPSRTKAVPLSKDEGTVFDDVTQTAGYAPAYHGGRHDTGHIRSGEDGQDSSQLAVYV